MKYKTFVSMNIAIVGSGDAAGVYAASFAIAGHEVYLARLNSETAPVSTVLQTFPNIHFCNIEEASAASDVIFISSKPKDVREIAYWLGDVRGKLIVDGTANVYTTKEEGLNTIGAIQSITGSDDIVKVFSTREYRILLKPLLNTEDIHMVLLGNSIKSKELVKILCRDLRISNFIDLGGFASLPLFDSMTQCWTELAKSGRNEPSLAAV